MPERQSPNIFLLAADASPSLLSVLRADPALASSQDASGYSLLHALTSYNHLELLRTVVREFRLAPDLRDEDGETALFAAETVEAAQLLVQDLGLDAAARNRDGQTAEEKIREEGDFTVVADYLKETRSRAGGAVPASSRSDADGAPAAPTHPPPLPRGLRVEVGSVGEDEIPTDIDPGMQRRIQELALRDDFAAEEGQRQLRQLVQEVVRDVGAESSNARRRIR